MEVRQKARDMLGMISLCLSCFAAGYAVGAFENAKSKMTAVSADIESARVRLQDIQRRRQE